MPVDWLTRSFNRERAGANLQEMTLTKSSVNVNGFGRLFVRAVDGQMYAQPLVVTGVNINGNVEAEVVIVATTQNFVYAFDAKDPVRCDPLWRTAQLGTPPVRQDFNNVPGYHSVAGAPDILPMPPRDYRDFSDELGIVATPVIDDAKTTIYVVAKCKKNGQFFVKLHKLDLATGKDLPGSPVEVGGSVSGTGFASKNGKIEFNTQWHLPRPGLLLAKGNVYMAFGAIGDEGPYHGWVFSYDANTLQRKAIHCATPNWGAGGIWQSGSGLAFADNYVYYVAGNGPDEKLTGRIGREPTDAELSSGPGFGNTIVKLDADTLDVVDWYSPTKTRQLSEKDDDLTSGPVLPQGTNLVLGFGKDGMIYACDRNNMGKWHKDGDKNVQAQKIARYHIHGTPVYWPDKKYLFLWSENDRCLQYELKGDTFPPPVRKFSAYSLGIDLPVPTYTDKTYQRMPGGMLTLSANGGDDGIIWAIHPTDKDANMAVVAGTLRALDADDLGLELWNSDHDPTGTDAVGNFAKFCPPTVANGKVYVATFSRGLAVYGLLPSMPPPTLGMWKQATIGTGVLGSASESCDRYTVLGAGRDIWDNADAFHFVYKDVAPGGTLTVTGLVVGMDNTNVWAKAGLMIRDTLDPDSPHAMIALTPGNGAVFQYRLAKGGKSFDAERSPAVGPPPGPAAQVAAPRWLQLIREPVAGQSGQFRFTARHSPDRMNWTVIGSPAAVPLGNSQKAGMAVTSHTSPGPTPHDIGGPEELNLARFDQVDIA
jgi:hypothetical protein